MRRGGLSLRIRTWLLGSHAVVLLLPVAVMLATGLLAHELRAQTRADLTHQAALLELLVRASLHDDDGGAVSLYEVGPTLSPVLTEARTRTLAGIRVVDHAGVVVASSGDELGESLAHRPEVADALQGAVALEVRPRPPPRTRSLDSVSRRAEVRLFLGVPLRIDDQVVGAVVLSRTPKEEMQAIYQAVPWWAVAVPVLWTTLIALTAAALMSRSLGRLARTSHRVAAGDFGAADDLDPALHSRVAEVRALAEAFATMTERLQARLAYIGEFAGNVSHEFKTPISTLRGTVELLQDDPEMPAAQRDRFLANATAELARLERLVTGLLDLARAEEAHARVPVDLDALVATAAARHPGITVTGTAGTITGDRAQLTSVVHNLLANAETYGGPTVTITLAREAQQASITVADDGPGIPVADQPRIFDRFFTTARGTGGTGVGLALVRAIVRAHGGEVTLTSQPGRTAFEVVLRG